MILFIIHNIYFLKFQLVLQFGILFGGGGGRIMIPIKNF
jgi:hypothetical protein